MNSNQNNMAELKYISDTLTLDEIIEEDIFFKIPIYQRLYVWGKEQIHALLSDIVSSYEKGDAGTDRIFYLGNVIVQKDERGDQTVYELIDGQQRFTTMWLLSIYLQSDLKKYAFPENGDSGKDNKQPLRIEFDIRDQVSDFMCEIIDHYNDDDLDDLDLEVLVQKNPEKGFDTGTLEPLANAFKEIKTFFSNHVDNDFDKEDFSKYVRNHVKLVKTIVPESADLNKLFEVLNNRGVQLEHHQILKARMLEMINKGKKLLEYDTGHYATLWDSCSGMNEFLEKGFQDAAGKRLSELHTYDRNTDGYTLYKDADEVLSELKRLDRVRKEDTKANNAQIVDGGLSLNEVLDKYISEEEQPDKSDNKILDERSQEIKSIINFPMLLQHALRIYLKERDREDIDRVLDKELLESFETHFFHYLEQKNDIEQAKEVRQFIELLWEVRFVFDEYVVKWIKDEATDILKLCNLYEKKDDDKVYLYRQTEPYKPELSQLQRLLYHSQEMRTFYWLTPFLYFLHKHYKSVNESGSDELALIYLKYLDNHLLNIDLQDYSDDPLINRTAKFMDEVKAGEITIQAPYIPSNEVLEKSLGLQFPHYWFYKLEFLLWRAMKDEKDISSFKITAKNSVEHIEPQTSKDWKNRGDNPIDEKLLDSFGNLALVSRSLNSSLSNARYKLKREKFFESNRDRKRIESLKLLNVYERDKDQWDKEDINKHKGKIIRYFEMYKGSCREKYYKLRSL